MTIRFQISMLFVCAFLTLFACQQKRESSSAPAPQQSESAAKSDEAPPLQPQTATPANSDIFSSAAARGGAIDSLKRFIRNAEMRFRTENTARAILQIEDIALQNGGFVLNSQLHNDIERQQLVPFSRDSSIETIRHRTQGQVEFRVPFQNLDTTLRRIGRIAQFLEYRRVGAEDVGLQLFEQELLRLREGEYRSEARYDGFKKSAPLADRLRKSQVSTDEARIETMKLEDAVRYSTVRIDVYQAPQLTQIKVANTEITTPDRPFLACLGEALGEGASMMGRIFLFIAQGWALILLLAAGYFAWKRWGAVVKTA